MIYGAEVTRPRLETRNCMAGDVAMTWTELDAMIYGIELGVMIHGAEL
jgi:hypothetical protein